MKKHFYHHSLRILLLIIAVGFTSATFAIDGNKGWDIKFANQKSFIENKGQFQINGKSENKAKVLYAVDNGPVKIYFTAKGLTYSFLKKWKKEEDKDQMEKEGKEGKSHAELEAEERQMKFTTDVVDMIWQGANPNAQLVAEDITPDYQSYSIPQKNSKPININHINSYRKLIYKNLYPGIDVEYTFHPEEGIKYALIVHPGADASVVKMKYDSNIKLNGAGDVLVNSRFGNIIDHAPVSFYSGDKSNIITSSFNRNGKTIGFNLGNYDHSKTVIIDPWVVTPTLPASNGVWECERDGAGNAYIIGGDTPMKLLKYSSAGILQWTYTTPWDTSQQDWLGTLATDLAGNSYVTNGSGAAMQKINTAGTMVWSVNGGGLDEYWSIAFNCDQTKLIVGGTRLNSLFPTGDGMIFDINTANGSVTATKIVGYDRPGFLGINDVEEVRAVTSSFNSRYYFLTLDSIGSFDQNFAACPGSNTLFNINDGYHFSYKMENYRPNNGNSGICAIKANRNFVYTQNGSTVHKRSLTTGAIITTAAIPGGVSNAVFGGTNQAGNSGIDIDSCGNVYVGSGNAVIKYDANLVQLSSVSVPFKVFDVAVSTGGNVIVCGATGDNSVNTRTGYAQQINMSACLPQVLICCDATVCPIAPLCTTSASVTLSPVVAGGTWSGTGVTAGGVFNPAVSGAGVFTITYTLPCGTGTVDITVNNCTPLSVCQNATGTLLTVSGGNGPYTWQQQVTTNPCVAGFGFCNGAFTVAGPPVTGWNTFATGTTAVPPGTFPLQVIDNVGTIFTITSLASIPFCVSCPPLTVSISAQVNVNCFGQSTGSFSASTSGGTGPYNYVLMNGASTVAAFSNVAGTQSFNGLGAATYTLNVTDANNCPGTATVTITQPSSALVTSITASTNPSCGGTNGSATGLASGGAAPYDYVWTGTAGTLQTTNNSNTSDVLNNLSAGTYTVTVTDNNGCTASATVTLSNSGGPSVSITSQTNVLCFGGATGNATASATLGASPYDYAWTGTAGTLQTTNNSVVPDVINNLAAGTYTITVTDSNGCIGTNTVTITQPASASSVSITASTNPPCGSNTGSATALANGGTSPYDYVWTGTAGTLQTTNNSTTQDVLNNLAGGTYTVTTTDNNGCVASATVTLTNTGGASVSITSQMDVLCFGGTTGSATANATLGVSPYDYVWTGSSGTVQTTNNSVVADVVNNLIAGTYTVIVTDNNGCIGSATVTITQPSSAPVVAITNTVNAPCNASSGSATALASGGTSPYDYVWTGSAGTLQTTNNSTSTDVLNNLAAGTYTITVTDNNGCTASNTAVITNTGGATVNITSQTNVLCFGGNTGNATSTATGGASPYDYVWTGTVGTLQTANNIAVPNTLNNLTAGTYTVTVTDNNNCVSSAVLTITQPVSALSVALVNSINATCGNSNGSGTVAASGGTIGGGYTYSWSPSGGNNASASGLAANTYTVTATDGNSCIATCLVVIANSTGPVVSITSQINVNCNGGNTGSATANATGGTGTLSYSWSGGGGTNATSSGLSAGTYTVTVTDGAGCSNASTVTITQNPAIILTTSSTPSNCSSNTGTASAIAGGGTGTLSYSWSPPGGSTSSINNLGAGTYTVTVTDSLGCTATNTATVASIGGPTADAGNDVTITAGNSTLLNGTGSLGATFSWSPSGSLSCNNCANPIATPAQTTTYTLTVTLNGCSTTDSVTVFIDILCGELFIPTAFSPNNDGQNDFLYVMGDCISNLQLAIFDRWGEKVFETTDQTVGWDGTFNGKKLDAGVFAYYLSATVKGQEVKKHGNITIVK